MAQVDKRKQSLYFNTSMLLMLQAEAKRLDRSISWVVQRCVKEGIAKVKEIPGLPTPGQD